MFLFIFISAIAASAAPFPSRVIALSPALTEMMFALKLEKSLVGVSDFADYPNKARELPSVGPYNKPSLEKILVMKPDLILLPKEGPEDIRFQLDRAKLKYEVFTMTKLDDIPAVAIQLGAILGQPEESRLFAEQWNIAVQKMTKNQQIQGIKALVELQKDPLIVAGGQTFLSEMIERCGGKNIFDDQKGYPRVSLELVLMRKPQRIFITGMLAKDTQASVKRWGEIFKSNVPRVVVLDPDTSTRPGPRLLSGLQKICDVMAVNQ